MASRITITRQTLTTPTSTQYTQRDGRAKFSEIDAHGRSAVADRHASAKRTVTSSRADQDPSRRRSR